MRIVPIGITAAALLGTASLAADQAHLWARPFEDRSPRIYSSAISTWRTAMDFRRTKTIRLAVEKPVTDRNSVLIGAQYGTREAEESRGWTRLEAMEWGAEAAFRHHPWPWMPGFFVQGMAGMERLRGRNPGFNPSMRTHWSDPAPDHLRLEIQDQWRGGLGFGYAWRMGPMVVDLQFLFGPRIRRTTTYYTRILDDGSRVESEEAFDESDSLLNFHDLRFGFSL